MQTDRNDLQVDSRRPGRSAPIVRGGTAAIGMVLALLAASPATAATYYVDSTGLDSNAGTSAAPWKTIQHAANLVKAGDTVLVAAGDYSERVTFPSGVAGTAGQLIVFRASPSRSATMQGFSTGDCSYLRIEGFQIKNSSGDGVVVSSDSVEIVDNYIFDTSGAGISGDGNKAHVLKNRIYKSQYGIILAGTGWLVENNEVERLYKWNSGDDDYCRVFGEDHVIRNNFFHGTQASEIGDSHVDGFQTFDDNGEHIKNILIEGNAIFNFHQGFMGESHFHNASSGITFRNNIFAHGLIGGGGAPWGLCVEAIDNLTAIHNVFADIVYFGVGLDLEATGAIIKDNIFYNVGESVATIKNGSTPAAWDCNFYNKNAPSSPGPNDIQANDPGFVDYAKDDYHVLATSAVVDAGCDAGLTIDKDGNPRPQGKGFDIGPYEFTTTPVGDHGMGGDGGALGDSAIVSNDGSGVIVTESGIIIPRDLGAVGESGRGGPRLSAGCGCAVAGRNDRPATGRGLLLGLAVCTLIVRRRLSKAAPPRQS